MKEKVKREGDEGKRIIKEVSGGAGLGGGADS